jgi:hypothetical protein
MAPPLDKVFISYSAKDCMQGSCAEAVAGRGPCPAGGCERERRERQFVRDLAACLQPLYEVVWDQDGKTLQVGEEWREALYTELAQCNAAIVVLTNSSTESVYVPLEAMVLMWRRLLDPTFLVIPVFFSSVNENTLRSPNSRFYGVGLEELQAAKLEHRPGDEQQTYAKIKTKLEPIKPKVPLESLFIAHDLAALLKAATPPRLEAAARRASVNLPWDPALSRPFLLALALLRCDLPNAVSALENLKDSLDLHARKRLCDLIIPLWVDLQAATVLQRERERKRLITLNAALTETAHHYADRAWSHQPRRVDMFDVTTVDEGTGTEIYSAVVRRVYESIIAEVPELHTGSETFEDMEDTLRGRSKEEPVLHVCIKHQPGLLTEALLELQAKLSLRIIYLREDARPESVGPNEYVVQPLLQPQAEKKAKGQWRDAMAALRRTK